MATQYADPHHSVRDEHHHSTTQRFLHQDLGFYLASTAVAHLLCTGVTRLIEQAECAVDPKRRLRSIGGALLLLLVGIFAAFELYMLCGRWC
jgi:hypothetical protein